MYIDIFQGWPSLDPVLALAMSPAAIVHLMQRRFQLMQASRALPSHPHRDVADLCKLPLRATLAHLRYHTGGYVDT